MKRRRANFWRVISVMALVGAGIWAWIAWSAWQEGQTAVAILEGGISAFELLSWLILLLLVRRKV